MQPNEVIVAPIATPVGTFGAAISPRGVGRLTFPAEPFAECHAWARRWAPGSIVLTAGEPLDRLTEQLNAYFEGRLTRFAIDLDMRGTPFQLEVWQALTTIPFGETRSYGQIAAQIGRPKAVRAVGAANGANPVPIIVPCHRVIGSNGKLTGFAGGLELKDRLLTFERFAG